MGFISGQFGVIVCAIDWAAAPQGSHKGKLLRFGEGEFLGGNGSGKEWTLAAHVPKHGLESARSHYDGRKERPAGATSVKSVYVLLVGNGRLKTDY